MSKENNNFRLLGSPINLLYRNKKREDKKSIKSRPHSALQNSAFSTETRENHKRPFSADAKEHAPSTRSFLKTFNDELMKSYNTPASIKVVAPTTKLLSDNRILKNNTAIREKDLCSNASDYGSEDTFISLGTKIKAKAQPPSKNRPSNVRNFLKYRNLIKKGKKNNQIVYEENITNDYGLEIKITERPQRPPSPYRNNMFADDYKDYLKTNSYESYFVPLDKNTNDPLAGRVSFGTKNVQPEVEQAIDTYSRRLTLTRQQLSLVEEESTKDVESMPSHNGSHESYVDAKNNKDINTDENTLVESNLYVADMTDMDTINKYTYNPKTYCSFYEDFKSNSNDITKDRLSSTIIHTDSSSKDSGYPESAGNETKPYKYDYSLPPAPIIKKSNSDEKLEQPKSLDSISSVSSTKSNTFPLQKKENISESSTVNHSRLLYKDFFLKKEGHIALPPNNSPKKVPELECTKTNEDVFHSTNTDYPTYLLNSTTKAYTSKVIDDYKKELEAINNLHELTIKDIKTDAISPTPFNIDKMFEHNVGTSNYNIQDDRTSTPSQIKSTFTSPQTTKSDISKVSTQELIQNYIKVKEEDYNNDHLNKNINKQEKNKSHNNLEDSFAAIEKKWNKKTVVNEFPVNLRSQNQRNMFTLRTPLSARIECVQNDKDIDSWMSLSSPSPRVQNNVQSNEEVVEVTEINNHIAPEELVAAYSKETESESIPLENAINQQDIIKPKELKTDSTVLDIYSMLKEIESYGESPVVKLDNNINKNMESVERGVQENSFAPIKDNFMEIFQFLEKVEQSANDALSVVSNTIPQTVPKLEVLMKLPQTELAQRLVTASLQLEERSCCIALLQESLANHKEQMINKVSNLEKQSTRSVAKVKLDCEDAIKRHQSFIDQLINDKKTLNHRIEQLVDERRTLEERWKRSAQGLEERYKLELKNQHDKMAAAQQLARQRWVKQKAEKIKELTVKGLEGELREMAERQQKEITDLKMAHAELAGRAHAQHQAEIERLRRTMDEEREAALVKERQLASSRLEKQILELEMTYQEQRTRLVAEMRAENDRAAAQINERGEQSKQQFERSKREQEKLLEAKKLQMEKEIAKERENIEVLLQQKTAELEEKFERFKLDFQCEQQILMKKKVAEISAQHKMERDREIEKAIESMEAEAQTGRKELQDALRRNKEQYECELKELGETEQATLKRYQEAQARIRQTEHKCADLEVELTQLETRNKVLIQKNTQLESQAEETRLSCDKAWRDKVDQLKREIEDLKKTHEEQMHQLYAKVKVAVARKDSAIQALTRESAKYQEKITLLEQKLQQQRKDFLGKK